MKADNVTVKPKLRGQRTVDWSAIHPLVTQAETLVGGRIRRGVGGPRLQRSHSF